MARQEHIDYIRANMDKYPMESLKQAILQAGAAPEEAEEAVRLALLPPAPSGAGSPPQPAEPFSPGRVIEQAKQVVFNPAVFFRSMPKKGGYKDPLLFLVSMALVSQILFLVLNFGMSVLNVGGGVLGVTALIFSFVMGLFMLPVFFLIATAVAHVVWMILGSKEDFETSFRCVAYLSAIAPLSAMVSWIPLAGVWLAIPVSLYGLYLYIPASVEVHGVKRTSAAIVVGIFALITVAGSVISIFSARKLKQLTNYAAQMQSGGNADKFRQMAEAMAKNAERGEAASESGSEAPAAEESAGETPQLQIPDSASEKQKQAMEMANEAIKAAAKAKTTEAVDAKELEALLPANLPNMTRGRPSSRSTNASGYNTSSASAVYRTKASKRITVNITDTGGLGALMSAGWKMEAGSGKSNTSFTEYKGFKTKERLSGGSKAPVMSILVGDRFVVEIRGSAGFSMKNLRYVADQMDLESLRAMGQ